jgi:FKBP-type peptidyl-prolyl cis-trans isomerase FkpA
MRRSIATAFLFLIAAILVAMAPAADQKFDYSTVPAAPEEVEKQLASCLSLAKATEAALGASKGIVKSAVLDPAATPPTATVVFYEAGKSFRVVVNASTGEVITRDELGRFPGDPVSGEWTQTASGLRYFDLKVGEGAMPVDPAATVMVHYTGWLTDGKKFDSSLDRGQPISFPLNRVIPGWREGVSTMKVGGKRKIIIPSELGYGARGTPDGSVPPKAMLIFDVELLKVEEPAKAPAPTAPPAPGTAPR